MLSLKGTEFLLVMIQASVIHHCYNKQSLVSMRKSVMTGVTYFDVLKYVEK
jgi:hypothetical protein